MPTNVDFFSLNSEAEEIKFGTISWDGQRFRFLGDNKDVLMKIVEDPDTGPTTGGIDPEDDPLGFMAELIKTYKSSVLRATEPYEGDPKP